LSSLEAHPAGAVPPSLLSSRLQSLNANSRNNSTRRLYGHSSGTNTPFSGLLDNDGTGYFDNTQSSDPSSAVLSRRTSEEENHVSNGASGYQTPEHVDYSILSKVPSYSTAIKSPARHMSYNDNLPNYDAALSAPPSPVRGFSNPGTPGAETLGLATPNVGDSHLSNLGFTPLHSPPAPNHAGDSDEIRRLQLLRNR
jgi:hypothetical protein